MTEGSTDDSTARPAARYGRPGLSRTSRRLIVAGLAAATAAATVTVAVVAYRRLNSAPVTGTMVGYQVIDDETASVILRVTRDDPSQPVECIVRARAYDGSETGRREILVPPSEDTTVVVTTTLKSSKPPFMADVYGCGTDVPAYLTPP
ncbi:DUF4307 domain-containing protein [Mycobacterium sp.]|uniref:DUF4307 domain-containing protein n=1 Tax=Mycobacterium sp. TaxID=1785 RepID=UPI003A87DE38